MIETRRVTQRAGEARVVARRRLTFAEGPDVASDRPGHLRAASALCFVDGRWWAVSDDSLFLAWWTDGGPVHAVTLPAGPDGVRQFGEDRGNKARKLDLEAAFVRDVGGVTCVVALGSGSTPARERLVVVPTAGGAPRVVDGGPLYRALRGARVFSGSELNVEGAIVLPSGDVRLFNRGNGAVVDGVLPVDATCDVDGDWFDALLRGEPVEAPSLRGVVQWDLGQLDGVRVTFTDASLAPDGAVWFTAAAEASPDTYADGEVAGSVVGQLDETGGWWVPVVDPASPRPHKVEGLAWDGDRLGLVVDPDDTTVAAVWLEAVLHPT